MASAHCAVCHDIAEALSVISARGEVAVVLLLVGIEQDSRAFVQTYKWPFPCLLDPRHQFQSLLGLEAVPSAVVVRRGGTPLVALPYVLPPIVEALGEELGRAARAVAAALGTFDAADAGSTGAVTSEPR